VFVEEETIPHAKTFAIDFDDYDSAPILSNKRDIEPNTWTFDGDGLMVLPSFWSSWKDRGYRLEPGFFSMSRVESPIGHRDRLLPFPQRLLQDGTVGEDAHKFCSLGACEMLCEAGQITNTKESSDVFVRGISRTGEFIKLDLEKDHIPIPNERVILSVDIDSVIWVSRNLQFRGPINLHLTPFSGDKPPFSTNNFVYVNVLNPPTVASEMNPTSRTKTRFTLSAIPHMPFGQFGHGPQQFNIYIFFPRMIKKNPSNGRMITLMPRDLQDLWLSDAIIPACRRVFENVPGSDEYLPGSLEQMRWKTGDHRRNSMIPLVPDSISALPRMLTQIIQDSHDLLGRFGSFFFVLDSRGIKLLTKQHKPGENAFSLLRNMVPHPDWDYMLDRENGELYLDLGISFHPDGGVAGDEHKVGLWRLSHLEDSYDLMGAKKGTTHHFCSLGDYGGRKSEMMGGIRHFDHLVSRISYNLYFEAVRQPGQGTYLCPDDDAVKANQRYLDACERWVHIFKAAEKRSFGVRDELRGSGSAIIELLQIAMNCGSAIIELLQIAMNCVSLKSHNPNGSFTKYIGNRIPSI
jgi:hypothetical protein